MEQKLGKMFLVFYIVAFELGAGNLTFLKRMLAIEDQCVKKHH